MLVDGKVVNGVHLIQDAMAKKQLEAPRQPLMAVAMAGKGKGKSKGRPRLM